MLSSTLRGMLPARGASNRALKRLRGHPKLWSTPKVPAVQPPGTVGTLRWEPVAHPEPAGGWLPPQGDTPADVPFVVTRSTKGQQLPVYSDFRHAGLKQYTIVRRIRGDVGVFAEELSKVAGGSKVTVRPGRVEVAGDHRANIRRWLLGLGF